MKRMHLSNMVCSCVYPCQHKREHLSYPGSEVANQLITSSTSRHHRQNQMRIDNYLARSHIA
jgi:hypothetical protein